MDNHGIPRFYFAKTLPPRAVAIAQISVDQVLPEDLVTLNNTVYLPGSLSVAAYPTGPSVDAAVVGNTVLISGSTDYLLQNQFFEITDQVDDQGNAFYYRHILSSTSVQDVTVQDLQGNAITSGWKMGSGELLHCLDGAAYWVRYYDGRTYKTQLLQYAPVWVRSAAAGPRQFVFTPGGLLTLPDTGTYRFRFTEKNGYQVLAPYSSPAGNPWYVRIRFGLRPMPVEWAEQPFQPARPYQLATWVPGQVLAPNLVELDRAFAWFDPQTGQYPDLLVYDKDWNLKYALDGRKVTLQQPASKGYLFPWRTSQILDMDPVRARVQVGVTLDNTDRVFGFYAYKEMDVVYRAIDINPYSNPAVKDKVIQFYFATRSASLHKLFYRVLNQDGSVATDGTGSLMTNDPAPADARTVFGVVTVGFTVGLNAFSTEDVRVLGGGLAPEFQSIPEAANFWDLGSLDGKPYPTGNVCVVQLPFSLLNTFSRDQIQAKIDRMLPMGAMAVIRFVDAAGQEYFDQVS